MNKEPITDDQVEQEAHKLRDKYHLGFVALDCLKQIVRDNLEQQRELRERNELQYKSRMDLMKQVNDAREALKRIEYLCEQEAYPITSILITVNKTLNPKGGDEKPVRDVGFEQVCREVGQCVNAIPIGLPTSPASEVTNEAQYISKNQPVVEKESYTNPYPQSEMEAHERFNAAQKELSTLRAELALKNSAIDRFTFVQTELFGKIKSLEATNTKLREALKKYGEHRAFCEIAFNPDRSCTCGLKEALV